MADDNTEQPEPEVVALSSSCIAQITYDFDSKETTIDFKDGRTVTYKTLPKEEFDILASSPNAGSYYNSFIKGKQK